LLYEEFLTLFVKSPVNSNTMLSMFCRSTWSTFNRRRITGKMAKHSWPLFSISL